MGSGSVTLIGSGEFLDAMAKVHRGLLGPLGTDVKAVLLDTPAGFELNLDAISERAVQYFAQKFEVGLGVASYRSSQASAAELSAALDLLRDANYIVAGPGSPTYAARTWSGSPVWEGVVERLRAGARVVLASAAAMAAGRWALPVYEIYRAGADPHWIEGLDLLGRYGLDLAVIAHWNNTDGGGYDTRFCFLGEGRLKALLSSLMPGTTVVGIDEHTACTFDLEKRRCEVAGIGSVTVIRDGAWTQHPAGSAFDFDDLIAEGAVASAPPEPVESPSPSASPTIATRLLRELAVALEEPTDPGSRQELVGVAHGAIHDLEAGSAEAHADRRVLDAAIELLQRARVELRSKRSFELADEIRDRLGEFGVRSEDRAL